MATFKAQSFLGCMTIRFGVILIALFQIAVGVSLCLSYGYLRPSLHGVAWTMLLMNAVTGVIGLIGAIRRNQSIMIFYLASYILSLSFLILSILSWTGIVQLMPKAPEGATTGFIQLDHSFGSFPVASRFRSFERSQPVASPEEDHAMLIQVLQHLDAIPLPDISKYEDVPFVPKPNEKEGESEEVSSDELPPEAANLDKDRKDLLTAMMKTQKRPAKLAIATLYSFVVAFEIYCIWILVTFIMNKCMSFDELTGAPEQFQALVGLE